ncbi:type II toxin-antitoxin system VapC family toxin [Candidatus Woesearchaeota archaeon]|nr:type II toxin-antitoxin system VapC family toxin [Candidatus Woesearchaeota archaeon]
MGDEEVVFVDANIFLEFALLGKESERCKAFLLKIKEGELLAMASDFIVYTCLLPIQWRLKSTDEMRKFIIFLYNLAGLQIYKPTTQNLFDAIAVAEKHSLDFDDALIVSCMKCNGISKLMSFDRHFDNIEGIERMEP